MCRNILPLLMIVLLGACATQAGVSGGVKGPGAQSGISTAGSIYSHDSYTHSRGFVSGDGSIQRSTRVPDGYPHYHHGYPARGNYQYRQYQRHEYHTHPHGRLRYQREDLKIHSQW